MKILLTNIINNNIVMIDTNSIIDAAEYEGFTRLKYFTNCGDEYIFINVKEPIHYITNACNCEFRVYYVKPGDTLSEIAQVLGVTLQHLLECNPKITNRNIIYPMQVLKY
ncbi:spore coat assembly [Morganella phage vB_MmoM_MP1]|uniref:Spore coat assembly n=1 Tax=Morganella phage vB_MmoM_MP1 TaxID=1852628 RepID=A0A192YAJ5_9CAUD|nr:spore coat assembly [Morganella phage vB_MmoM_MP1]ANM46557.1 spore coat assembly [Morganella phage vB_MmoM_MP1]